MRICRSVGDVCMIVTEDLVRVFSKNFGTGGKHSLITILPWGYRNTAYYVLTVQHLLWFLARFSMITHSFSKPLLLCRRQPYSSRHNQPSYRPVSLGSRPTSRRLPGTVHFHKMALWWRTSPHTVTRLQAIPDWIHVWGMPLKPNITKTWPRQA